MTAAVDRSRAEEALRATEERFSRIVETTHEGIWMIDAESRTTFVNRRMSEILGYTPEEMLGTPLFLYVGDDSREEAERAVERRRQGISEEHEFRFRRKDGVDVWTLLSTSPLRSEDGGYAGALAMVNDISARKQAEEALRASEEKYRRIVETAHEGVWITDAESRTTYVNRRMAEMLGYEAGELVGRQFFDFLTEESQAIARQKTVRRKRGIRESYELTARRKDGSEVATLVSASPIVSKGRTFAGSVKMVSDLTEHKLAETYLDLRRNVLQILNESGDLADSIRRVVDEMKRATGMDAVGIRLQAGDDFPYLSVDGFPEEFVLTEDSLTGHRPDGEVCRDEDGRVRLECTCGLVLSSGTGPESPLLTPAGSFWTNDAVHLLDLPVSEDPRVSPRNRCIRQGYASVALVPIRCGERILGLVQLNDSRRGRFGAEMIGHLERLAEHIGTALARRRTEEALRESEDRYRRLSEELERRVAERTEELTRNRQLLDETARLSRVGGWEYLPGTGELTWTDETYEIHDVEPGTLQTLEAGLGYYVPESRPRIAEVFQRALATGEPFDEELEMVTARGRRIWVRTIGHAYSEGGTVARLGGVLQDVTAQRERIGQLEDAVREVDAYSYSISHELRTPLRAIDGFSARIVRHLDGALDGEGRRLFGEVRWNARRMGQLLDDLLAFSRTGRSGLVFGNVDMTASAMAAFERVVPDPGSRSRISFAVGDLPRVLGDGTVLRRVWENLLSNAVKFSASRERPEIRVEGSVEGGETVYRVRDNGIGFDMKYVDKLFGVFNRLHGIHEFEGTGVGLALVRRIVLRHGGRVWAEGEPGRGAAFNFTLPRTELRPEPASPGNVR